MDALSADNPILFNDRARKGWREKDGAKRIIHRSLMRVAGRLLILNCWYERDLARSTIEGTIVESGSGSTKGKESMWEIGG